MNLEAARDPASYFDHRCIVSDMIDLLNELADMLADKASHGDFGAHVHWTSQADLMLDKLNRTVSPPVLDLFRPEAERAIARLRAAFQLSDIMGRA